MRPTRTITPLRVLVQFALIGVLVLWLAQTYGERLIAGLVPTFRTALRALQDDFTILDLSVVHENAGAVVRVRADFAHPLYVAGRVLYPMNSNPQTAGWMQIDLTVGGILQYFVMAAIVLFAWPWGSLREYAVRLAIGMALGALLTGFAAVSTILAELWFPLHADLAPAEVWPLLVWSRFLMGGGGAALVLGLAVIAIALAAMLTAGGEADAPRPQYA